VVSLIQALKEPHRKIPREGQPGSTSDDPTIPWCSCGSGCFEGRIHHHEFFFVKCHRLCRAGTTRIVLIDGEKLGKLMIQYGVGVRAESKVKIKRIDLDYFDSEEE
jgi:hypothetical protein